MKIGVIADTHVPDRRMSLDPRILPVFREAGVEIILHAGDVSAPRVLKELGTVAPVQAVGGNRDWLMNRLPPYRLLEFEGVTVVLAHGHGRWWNYLVDKVKVLLHGNRLEVFVPRLLAAFPQARVIVFGHTHRPVNLWMGEQLLFNPGSPHFPDLRMYAPSVGLLHIEAGGKVRGEIVNL